MCLLAPVGGNHFRHRIGLFLLEEPLKLFDSFHISVIRMLRLHGENVSLVDLEGSLACRSYPGRANFSYLVHQLHEEF